jgi:hypothetical protein
MADEVDVENTLVGIIEAALYPNGINQPCVANVACSVFRGWPTVQQTNAAKKNSSAMVSVTARNGVERNTSRYPMTWQEATAAIHTLTANVTDNIITLGGTVSVPQNVVALIGQSDVYSYSVKADDTLSSIASNLAALVAQDYPGASSNGPVITINGTGKSIVCRIAGVGTISQEVKRQEKSFQISVWSPPAADASKDADYYRTSVSKVIDPTLGALIRVVLPDNTYAHIHYERTINFDTAQTEGLYRRDFFYWVEYATTLQQPAYEIGAFQQQTQVSASPTGTLPVPDNAPVRITNS